MRALALGASAARGVMLAARPLPGSCLSVGACICAPALMPAFFLVRGLPGTGVGRRANGDISVAVAMHFDDGAADEPAGAANPSAVPVAYAESAHEDDVLEEQMAAFSVQEGTGGPRTPRETSAAQAPTPGGSADRGPTSQVGSAPHNEPRDAHEAGNGVNGNGLLLLLRVPSSQRASCRLRCRRGGSEGFPCVYALCCGYLALAYVRVSYLFGWY